MKHENFAIEIEGQAVSDLYSNLISLEVELDDELSSMFRLQIAIEKQPDGLWSYLYDERLMVWKPVTITAGFEDGIDELISGYITHIKPSFDPNPTECRLEIWGMDSSVLMDRQEQLKDWPNKKDSDIASEIFNFYGLTPKVDDTEVVHDDNVSTIIQRETDLQFLRRLAIRNGFECYVEGKKGYFRKPRMDDKPQPVLALHFGAETSITCFSAEINVLKPVDVSMFQVDRMNKEILEATAKSSQQKSLGKTTATALLAAGMDPAKIYVAMSTATGTPEMTALCQGLFHQGEWFVTGEGEIDSKCYKHVLKPRKTVTVKGAGETYSGVYYVSHVTHAFSAEGYTQAFRVKRNAIMPSGSEDFSVS